MKKYFLSKLIRTKESKLAEALLYGNYNEALILAQKIRTVRSYSYYRDEKVLDLAAKKGYLEVCELLIDKGAEINIQDWEGWSTLHKTCQKSHPYVVQLLLDRGAQVDLQTNNGETALMIASSHGYSAIVKLLLDRGAKVDLQANNGETALMVASKYGHTTVVKLLLDEDEATALMPTSQNGHEEIVETHLHTEFEGQSNNSNQQHSNVTEEDIDCIRDFLRRKALDWWESSDSNWLGNTAACDWYCDEIMGREIERNDGYLLGKRLLCKPCCDKILEKMTGKPIKTLDIAWEVDLFDIALSERRKFNH